MRSEGDEAVVNQLREEVRDDSWRFVEMRPDASALATSLATLAGQSSASAAVRVNARRGEIELWVNGRLGQTEEVIATPGEAPSAQVLALRVAETLRARGLRFASNAAETAPSIVAPSPPPAAPAKPLPTVPTRSRRFWLELDAALALSAGGVGVQSLAGLALQPELGARTRVAACALAPLSSAKVSASEGDASISTWLIGGNVELDVVRRGRTSFGLGSGAAWALTSMKGRATTGFVSRGDSVSTLLVFARAALRVEVANEFRLTLQPLLGWSVPEVSIRFAEREAATLGRPLFVGLVGVESALFAF